MRLGVIILAAGASVRMGRPKLLLPWKSTTVLSHLLSQWTSLGPEQIAVVVDTRNAALDAELDRIGWPAAPRILNPAPERGMFSSVRCAAQWTGWKPALTHWAICLGDQPLVRTSTIQRLLEFTSEQAAWPAGGSFSGAEPRPLVCQPERNGRGRHPVILSGPVWAQLKTAEADDLKQFLVRGGWPILRCPMEDPGLDLDLDNPSDYDRALAQASKGERDE
jgi:molybdenum cofactor cytidylyltransferase